MPNAARCGWFVVLILGALACSREPAATVALQLVDVYRPESVVGRPAGITAPPRTEWRFDGERPQGVAEELAATWGWEAGPGVAGLDVEDGRLVGRATDDFPLLHLDWPQAAAGADTLHAIEVRLRVSAGESVGANGSDDERVDLAEVVKNARDWPWDTTAKLEPGGKLQTVTLRPPRPMVATRHLLLRPTDAAGAEFAIESVRLVFRREHLASIPSGVGFQGLAQVYRESLVARAPEVIRLPLDIREHAFLDLAIGTIEEGPVSFRVAFGTAAEEEETLLERTVTTPHRWEPVAIDLAPFAGHRGTLSLALAAQAEGAIGLWGSPVVRVRGGQPKSAAVAPPRGIIIVWMDTLRRDHLGAYGYDRATSPMIDRLAAAGARFERCITPGTWTKVATPSLMTSLHPSSHRVLDFSQRLPAAATTLAEVYRDAGYATLSMSSILFTGQFTNLHQGFEELHEDTSLPDQRSSKTARVYVDRLLPWLEAHRDVPFFIFLHIADPHDPYEPAAPYNALWSDPRGKREHEQQQEAARRVIAEPLLRAFGMPTRADLERAGFDANAYVEYDRGWYDGSILGMDAEIGRLVERLGELGLERHTLLVLIGDHGEEFLEHGRTFHGQTTYGELANVPLVVSWPATVAAGQVVAETVSTVDLMPTLLAASGLALPAAAQGQSLLPLIAPGGGAPFRERPVLVEKHITTEPVGAPPPTDTESFALLADSWKLIHNTVRPRGGPEFELYDAARDRLDSRDVAGEHPEIVARLTAELVALRQRLEAARLSADEEAVKGLSPEELERLRSLGYVQ